MRCRSPRVLPPTATARWSVAIRVFCYLKGTYAMSLVLGGTSAVLPCRFSDSDYAYANHGDTSRFAIFSPSLQHA